jgi:uncharacterized membrane protein HdeD (DUF308 family)
MATRASPNPRWWIGAVGGIVAILFGLSLLFWPHLTMRTLLSIVGAYVLVAGVLMVIGAMHAAEHNRLSSRQIVVGGVGVIVGALAFLAPGIAATVLLYLIAVWDTIAGVPRVVHGLQAHDWELSASGAVLIVLALVLLVYAGPAILTVTWLVGLLVLVYGALTLMRSVRARGLPSVS